MLGAMPPNLGACAVCVVTLQLLSLVVPDGMQYLKKADDLLQTLDKTTRMSSIKQGNALMVEQRERRESEVMKEETSS